MNGKSPETSSNKVDSNQKQQHHSDNRQPQPAKTQQASRDENSKMAATVTSQKVVETEAKPSLFVWSESRDSHSEKDYGKSPIFIRHNYLSKFGDVNCFLLISRSRIGTVYCVQVSKF